MNRYLLAASAAVAALAMAPAANATNFNINLSQNGSNYTADFGNKGLNGSFNDSFTFLPSIAEAIGDVSFIQVGFNTAAITVTSLSIDGYDLMPFLLVQPGGSALIKLGINLASGSHVVAVGGTAGKNASYSGTVNFEVVPVPEPASWAMMLVGIAAVGMTMRARTRMRIAFS